VKTYQNGLTALGDPTRRAIFERLADRPQAVGDRKERGIEDKNQKSK